MDAQWTPRFEDLKHRVESAFRSDSRDFVTAVHRDLEQSKSSIYALLDTPRPNEAHRARLKLGKRLFCSTQSNMPSAKGKQGQRLNIPYGQVMLTSPKNS